MSDKNVYWKETEFNNLLNWYFIPNNDNPKLEH